MLLTHDLYVWKTKTTNDPGIPFQIQANRLETRLDMREKEIGSALEVSNHEGSEDRRLTRQTRQMKSGESARELRLSMI